MKPAAVFALLAVAACACQRAPAATDPPDAAALADASPDPAPSDAAPALPPDAAPDDALAFGLPPAPVEPRRASLRTLAQDRALAPHEAVLRAHFDGALPSPIEVQVAPLAGRRRATLVTGEARRRNPMLLVTSDKGDLLWTKEKPLAGTRQVVTEMVPSAGPYGEVSLMWCDIPTQVVGLRTWGPDGGVLADFEVLEVDVCEALSGMYWPGRGWLAVTSQQGGARAQLLDEAGKRTWGPRGMALPWKALPSSPASMAAFDEGSVLLLQVGTKAGAADAERVLAMRYDTRGNPLWDGPLDLGPPPAGTKGPAPRVRAEPAGSGNVRVDLGARGVVTVTAVGGILGAR